ncbi:potassium-transporting ATPase subunit KdpC [Acidipila sp. EB88]|uniref:potassium-transporting ATPase subunit KdpC n=1 Tax=Acidipila sp. EB88 TaxID=2305226 RepID=UPI000F5F659A|nr:potassium-transporting ATPase subunit KdpC [Acidipila sp. EB88]RRA48703.1 potassium-transporting ATPase subunit KdpC [Acidipila sp. EB88]
MQKLVRTAVLYTAITSVFLGLVYPLAITAVAHLVFPSQAAGQLLHNSQGELVGSALIGQPFSGPRYFHSRPSAAGAGYDAAASSGSNLAPTNKALIDRVQSSVAAEQAMNHSAAAVPVDLVTASGSGLDPDITPAAAEYQVLRVAAARAIDPARLRLLVQQHTTQRQFGLLGEPRVAVLPLNLALDALLVSR